MTDEPSVRISEEIVIRNGSLAAHYVEGERRYSSKDYDKDMGWRPKPGRPSGRRITAAMISKEFERQRSRWEHGEQKRVTQATVAEALHLEVRQLRRIWKPLTWPPE